MSARGYWREGACAVKDVCKRKLATSLGEARYMLGYHPGFTASGSVQEGRDA
jgi:hypothetical protein